MANTKPLSPAAVGSKHVSAIGERRAVDILKDTLGISEWLACKVLGLASFPPIGVCRSRRLQPQQQCFGPVDRVADRRRDSVFLLRRYRRIINSTTIS